MYGVRRDREKERQAGQQADTQKVRERQIVVKNVGNGSREEVMSLIFHAQRKYPLRDGY